VRATGHNNHGTDKENKQTTTPFHRIPAIVIAALKLASPK
jgi:hypothetical protein